ncbi:hypothetical protein B9479_008282 [Cryptococcus floricola]|uniref:Uncharacterized protein n=1 Tax=Cryptococcus floricola TaxID=2591691 RepID=A0A5D3AMB7_9TREE|nr:hypothetical protein B9479_008282 [Cryptococcus floricola]
MAPSSVVSLIPLAKEQHHGVAFIVILVIIIILVISLLVVHHGTIVIIIADKEVSKACRRLSDTRAQYPDPDDDTDSRDRLLTLGTPTITTQKLTSSADAPLERILYLLSDRPSVDQADKLHLVGPYLKISGYFKGMSSPSKLIKDYYRL